MYSSFAEQSCRYSSDMVADRSSSSMSEESENVGTLMASMELTWRARQRQAAP
jgi:hypothetical protein